RTTTGCTGGPGGTGRGTTSSPTTAIPTGTSSSCSRRSTWCTTRPRATGSRGRGTRSTRCTRRPGRSTWPRSTSGARSTVRPWTTDPPRPGRGSAQVVGGRREEGERGGDRLQVVAEHFPVHVADAVAGPVVAAVVDLARLPAPDPGLLG